MMEQKSNPAFVADFWSGQALDESLALCLSVMREMRFAEARILVRGRDVAFESTASVWKDRMNVPRRELPVFLAETFPMRAVNKAHPTSFVQSPCGMVCDRKPDAVLSYECIFTVPGLHKESLGKDLAERFELAAVKRLKEWQNTCRERFGFSEPLAFLFRTHLFPGPRSLLLLVSLEAKHDFP